MPQPGTQLNGKLSRRGRQSEGRPTKKTPETVARISQAISFGLTDEETSALVDIEPDTFRAWKTDPEFFGAIKKAVAARLVKRLEKIEKGGNGWQGCAWLIERLMPARYAKPEVQISLNSSLSPTHNALTLTISLEDAERLERESEPIRQAARQLLEEYERNRNGSHSVEASAEVVDAELCPASQQSPSKLRRGRDQYLRNRR
jgi:hypothetical protein